MPTKKTPTKIAQKRGNPGHAKLNTREPQYGPLTSEPPEDLQRTDERQVWERLFPILDGAGVLTAADRDGLAALCRVTARFYRTEDTHEMMAASREMRMRGALFGMSPSDRARLQAPEKGAPKDALEDMLTGPQGLVKSG